MASPLLAAFRGRRVETTRSDESVDRRRLGVPARLHEALGRVLMAVAGILFVVGVVAAGLGVLSRHMSSLLPNFGWTAELTRYSIIAAVFLILGVGIRDRTHIAVTVLIDRFPPPLYRAVAVLNSLLMMAFFAVITYYGYKVANLNAGQKSPLLHLSFRYPYLVVSLSGALMFLETAIQCVQALRGRIAPPDGALQEIPPA